MGVEVFMARADQAGCRRYQRLRGDDDGGEEVVLVGDGEKPARAATAAADGGRWVRTSSWRPLRLRRRAGKKAVPVLFRKSRRRAGAVAGGGGMKIKVRLMRLLLLVPARRVAALFAELVRRIASAGAAAAECPAIVFSSQWGLPVLSHSASVGGASRTAQLRAFYLERSLSAASTAGGSSPC